MSNRKTNLRLIIIAIFTLAMTGCWSIITPSVNEELIMLRPGNYKIDPTHATVLFKVQHLQLSTFVGSFNQVQAKLDFNPKAIERTRLSATIDIASIDTNNVELNETLLQSNWFNVKEHPQMEFTTISVEPIDKSSFNFTGALTMLGITKPIVLKVTFHGGADNWLTGKYTLGFSATGKLKRSDFGMDSYIPLVGDEVSIEVYAEFNKI